MLFITKLKGWRFEREANCLTVISFGMSTIIESEKSIVIVKSFRAEIASRFFSNGDILNFFKCVQFSIPLRSLREKQFDKSK